MSDRSVIPLIQRYMAKSCVDTNDAQRYFQRLYRHFSHSILVTLSQGKKSQEKEAKGEEVELKGCFEFSMGFCDICASVDCLTFYYEANNLSDLNEIIETIESHLKRFSVPKTLDLTRS